MRREAVQDERQKHKDKNNDPGSPSNLPSSNSMNDLNNETTNQEEDDDLYLTSEELMFLNRVEEIENKCYPIIDRPYEKVIRYRQFIFILIHFSILV